MPPSHSTNRACAERWSSFDKWVSISDSAETPLPHGWRRCKVKNIVDIVTERELVLSEQTYDMAGVRLDGGGIYHRETVLGKETTAKYLTRLKPGCFIYGRLFAWRGAFGVVKEEHANLWCSNEFPQFRPRAERVTADFLSRWILSTNVLERVGKVSVGTSAVSRNRFKEVELLDFTIDLPPLNEQIAILAHWGAAQGRIRELVAQAEVVMQEVAVELLRPFSIELRPRKSNRPRYFSLTWRRVEQWSYAAVAEQIFGWQPLQSCTVPVVPLGSVSAVSYGIQKSPANRPGHHARPYLRVANVRKGYIDLTEVKEINVPDNEFARFKLEKDDLLFVEGNGSRAELGRVAKWEGLIKDCVHQNHLIKVRIDQTRLLPDFAVFWFNTDAGRSHFFKAAKTSSGLGTINSHEVRSAPIPLLPLVEQRRLVSALNDAKDRANWLRAEADRVRIQTATEVEGMILGTIQAAD